MTTIDFVKKLSSEADGSEEVIQVLQDWSGQVWTLF
jgi:hypothetical protein